MPSLTFTLTHLCYTHDSKFIRFTFIHTLTIIHLCCPYIHVYTTFVFIFIRVMFSFALLQLCYTYTHTHVFYSYLNIHVLHLIFTFTSILMHLVFILIFILVFTLVLVFILSFIRFMLYTYFCCTLIYTNFVHTHVIRLCSNCAHIYAHFNTRYAYTFAHTPGMRFMFMLTCVFKFKLILCSCFLLKIYTFAHVHGRNPKDSFTLVLYYLECEHAYMLHFYTHPILFSKFMYTLIHTQISTSYADHATIGIIAGAHGIIVISA